jgi:hypothetical protein
MAAATAAAAWAYCHLQEVAVWLRPAVVVGSVRLECQSRDGLYTIGGADEVVGGLQFSSSAATAHVHPRARRWAQP